MTVERVGVSFEPGLLAKFDNLIKAKGYTNRSEAIRDLVRKAIMDAEIRTEKGEVIGTLTIVYDHDVGDITHKLMHIQHDHHSETVFTSHIHVDEKVCLEVVVVRGKAGNVRKLADNIRAIRGVRSGELVVTKTKL
jgi:CopG family nickel-responsive transcriptional regulator